jgi:archaemetzincin
MRPPAGKGPPGALDGPRKRAYRFGDGASVVIQVIRIGEVEGSLLEGLVRPLSECFPQEVVPGSTLPIPAECWNRRREQYAAEVLLRLVPPGPAGARTLCLVDLDLFVRDMAYVFGVADEGAGKAVVSLWRLKPEVYYLPPDDTLLGRRLLTEAVHEIGHTYGLGHCTSGACAMRFSLTVAETDAKGPRLCRSCRAAVERAASS